MSYQAPDEIPEHYRNLLKDWLRIAVPPHANPHTIAAKCNIPIGSYFVTSGAMLLEAKAYLDAVKPLLAAEEIGLHPTQPTLEQSEPLEEPVHEEPAEGDLAEDELAHGRDGD